MNHQPDWLQCLACRTVYAPALTGAERCPRCGGGDWLPTAIPDGDEPLSPPLRIAATG